MKDTRQLQAIFEHKVQVKSNKFYMKEIKQLCAVSECLHEQGNFDSVINLGMLQLLLLLLFIYSAYISLDIDL